jgi:head-tail adaptor
MDDIELTRIRADISELMPDTGYILTVTRTSDGGGGWTDSWGTASTVTCRVDYTRGVEVQAGGAIQPKRQLVATVPYSTVVTTENRFQFNATAFAISSVNAGSWQTCKRLMLEAL